jgi:hypothetical protein
MPVLMVDMLLCSKGRVESVVITDGRSRGTSSPMLSAAVLPVKAVSLLMSGSS